jgi:hypothetical protein
VALCVAAALEPVPEKTPVVVLQPCFGRPFEEKEELIPGPVAGLDGREGPGVRVAYGKYGEAVYPFGCLKGHQPGDGCSPVVAYDVGRSRSSVSKIAR